MVFKKILRGFPVLGVLGMLLACPAGDTDTVTGADGKPVKFDPTKMQADIKALQDKSLNYMDKDGILKAIGLQGKIDFGSDKTKYAEKAWGKLAQIMATTHPNSCMYFYPPSILSGPTTDADTALTGGDIHKVGTYGGTFTIGARLIAGGAAIKPKVMVANSGIYYDFKDYSVDGIYKLTGKLTFKTTGALAVVAKDSFPKTVAYEIEGTDKELTLVLIDKAKDKDAFPVGVQKITFDFGVTGKKFKVTTTTLTCPKVAVGEIKVKLDGLTPAVGGDILPADKLYKALFSGDLSAIPGTYAAGA